MSNSSAPLQARGQPCMLCGRFVDQYCKEQSLPDALLGCVPCPLTFYGVPGTCHLVVFPALNSKAGPNRFHVHDPFGSQRCVNAVGLVAGVMLVGSGIRPVWSRILTTAWPPHHGHKHPYAVIGISIDRELGADTCYSRKLTNKSGIDLCHRGSRKRSDAYKMVICMCAG